MVVCDDIIEVSDDIIDVADDIADDSEGTMEVCDMLVGLELLIVE